MYLTFLKLKFVSHNRFDIHRLPIRPKSFSFANGSSDRPRTKTSNSNPAWWRPSSPEIWLIALPWKIWYYTFLICDIDKKSRSGIAFLVCDKNKKLKMFFRNFLLICLLFFVIKVIKCYTLC